MISLLMPFQHSLSCPYAGQWHLLFSRKKVNKKLSPAQFAMEGSALAVSSLPQIPRAKLSAFNVSAWAGLNVLDPELTLNVAIKRKLKTICFSF